MNIDGQEIEAREGENLLEVALRHGIYIPHFCYHPMLSVAGSCRMCLVEVEKSPKLVPACATPVLQNLVVWTNSERVKKARAGVMEFLLLNHPLDCPVCDKAGECKLQDYCFYYGNPLSRRKHPRIQMAKKDLSPHIIFYSDRCIMCTRCIRFLNEITKTSELAVSYRGAFSEIDICIDHPIENPLSGNVIDLCPVGALKSKDFLFKKRVWWLESVESVCARCARGCPIRVDYADGRIYRIRSPMKFWEVLSWICDFGRFGFKFVEDPSRLLSPLVKADGGLSERSWDEAIRRTSEILSSSFERGGESVLFALSPFMTCEEARELVLLAKDLDAHLTLLPSPEGEEFEFTDFKIEKEKAPNSRGVIQIAEQLYRLEPFEEACGRIEAGEIRTAFAVLGYPEPYDFELPKPERLIAVDIVRSRLIGEADVVLAGSTSFEKEGTFIGTLGEGRLVKALEPPGKARSELSIFRQIKEALLAKVEKR